VWWSLLTKPSFFFFKKMLDIYKSFWICLSLFFSQHITTNYTCMQLCKINNVMFYIITDQRLVLVPLLILVICAVKSR
jgi:hypothetical protein